MKESTCVQGEIKHKRCVMDMGALLKPKVCLKTEKSLITMLNFKYSSCIMNTVILRPSINTLSNLTDALKFTA